jgi:hypothetical protein
MTKAATSKAARLCGRQGAQRFGADRIGEGHDLPAELA